MRIVHISDCYLPRLGGIEVQVRALAQAQVARGDEVTVITATPSTEDGFRVEDAIDFGKQAYTAIRAFVDKRRGHNVSDEPAFPATMEADRDGGVDVLRFDAKLPFDTPVHPRGTAIIREQLQRIQPDVVHIHAGVVSPFAWMGIAAASEFTTLVTVHSMWGQIAQRGYGFALPNETTFLWSAVSNAAADAVRLATGKHVVVTPNAIDAAPWRALEPVEHDVVHIVAALRFAPRKRSLALVKMLADARRLVPAEIPMRATIAGSGPLLVQLRRMIAKEQLDWINLPGRLTREQLASLYAGADIFIQPTVQEAFGLAALEARAAGLAVVGMAGSGLSEFVIDGVNGLLVHGDAAMASAIRGLVMNRENTQAMKQFNRTHAPSHNWEHALAAVDAAYMQAGNLRS